MNRLRKTLLSGLLAASLLLTATTAISAENNPVEPWKQNVQIKPVSAVADRHTIHSYYLANPESPDGRYVLYFTSKHPAAQVGELRILNRATAEETLIAADVHTEDAHRVACQQWLAGGKYIAWHEVVGKKWQVVVYDLDAKQKRVVAENRQIGFGQPGGHLLPMYGCHWNPGPYRDLYIWNANTGEVSTAITIAQVEEQLKDWLAKEFQGKPTSVFFPVLSPNLELVFFKPAAGSGGDEYMSGSASRRRGLACFDLKSQRLVWFREKWGHPAWHPDSRHILEKGNVLFDTAVPASSYQKLRKVPSPSGSHPSVGPDGELMVTDGDCSRYGAEPKQWGIVVGDLHDRDWVLLDSFDQSGGAKSWRRNHPHPSFNADGRRIYYNVNDGKFTRLFVAERQ